MLRIDGNYLEGGGQILRTSLGLATILNKEIEVFNIRKKRPNPGLAEQHLRVIEAFQEIFGAKTEGAKLSSQTIRFFPSSKIKNDYIKITPSTSSSIGLILQAILVPIFFLKKKLTLEITGGTSGKWAPPIDFYPNVVFPILGINAKVEIKKRGYFPKGGGLVVIDFKDFSTFKLELIDRGNLEKIKIMSFASKELKEYLIAEKQSEKAKSILKEKLKKLPPIEAENSYFETLSLGSELNLCAYFSNGVILWSDSLKDKNISWEDVAKNAVEILIEELKSQSSCDFHLADNIIPYLALYGGRIKTSKITKHTLTNIWVCENFLGKVFKINNNIIEAVGYFS
ncbi:MAG: RNA 3'-terminal phosphate cyclase [Candidatus Aenigmatarchaeota archaeon]